MLRNCVTASHRGLAAGTPHSLAAQLLLPRRISACKGEAIWVDQAQTDAQNSYRTAADTGQVPEAPEVTLLLAKLLP